METVKETPLRLASGTANFEGEANDVRYLINARGDKTDIILPMDVWIKLVHWIEKQDDRNVVQQWLPRLRLGPNQAGALAWDDVVDGWDND